jgi:hypothetical protein
LGRFDAGITEGGGEAFRPSRQQTISPSSKVFGFKIGKNLGQSSAGMV